MKITTKNQASHVRKDSGIIVDYYKFKEYQLHFDEQPSGARTDWHHHDKISEALFILEGTAKLKWKENGEIKEQILNPGDLAEMEQNPHSLINDSSETIRYITLKQLLTGENKEEIFKKDKIVDDEN